MIYGDNPQKINEREDKLGLKTYSYAPQISAIMQAGNLYVYGINNPVLLHDPTGSIAFLAVTALAGIGGVVGLGSGAVIASSATGTALASFSQVALSGSSWAASTTVASAGGSAAIGRQFEKWFYNFYNIGKSAQQVAVKGLGRIDAFLNGHIFELKNYNWALYSASKLKNVISNFVEQASRYMKVSHIGTETVKGVVFYFSSKPPQAVIEALTKAGVTVQWVSTIK